MSPDPASPRGVDLAALTLWLDEHHPGLRGGPLSAELIAGGRSNLTYTLDDGAHRWVLRRPPLGHVLATAHDMAREFRVISALHAAHDTAHVPVPEPVLLCDDESVIGAPFYVMQRVDGVVLRDRAALLGVPEDERAGLANRLVDTLAALHRSDPKSLGLNDFGRPDGFLERQVRRWSTQLEASRSREVEGIDALRDALAGAVPTSPRPSVVHGDFRLDNLLVRPGAWDVAAVLDWEMATLGDPLTDLGLLLVYWGEGGEVASSLGPVADTPASVAGFPDGSALAARYAATTGTDLTSLPWYVAFGYFKLAVILEGIHYRYTQGQTVGSGFDGIGAVVPGLVAAGAAALAR
ncbi:phosphotransferase family protein [Angustibacter sp. Root456]|uniref:phosphotransferase family protein n=1 Tax=Angustibacter sp. Root456 TaxID=1736539 RepID=UPI0006FE1806|nr:phosphotransferase family protein [Angustibacter sp. Root456]KQX65759.1 acyl-CoA dehydrogenase [Angustibacter sp. Root456]